MTRDDRAAVSLHLDRRGAGSPLLLLHGFFGCSADFNHLFDLDALSSRHTLLMPDLRGHGRSPYVDVRFTHRACARDVLALLDAEGIGSVDAIGISAGGNTLLHLATAWPDRVRAMVIVSACDRYPTQARAIMRTVDAETQGPEEWRGMRERHAGGDPQIRALFAHARGFAEDQDDMVFTPETLSAIQARTLVVGSDSDPFYPVDTFVTLHREIPAANLCILPCEGHAPVFGASKAYFVDRALGFLATSPP